MFGIEFLQNFLYELLVDLRSKIWNYFPLAKERVIKKGISAKRLLECDYGGYHRIFEPHIYGIKNGEDAILTYQIGGESSSGGIPNWRRMKLEKMTNVRFHGGKFPGSRDTKGPPSPFDGYYLIVS